LARIVFISPFSRTEITGGIKTTYRQAELLRELGFDAQIFQTEAPSWFATKLKPLAAIPSASAADVFVFPEIMNGLIGELARRPMPVKKAVFCQNQYFMALNGVMPEQYSALGFSRFATTSSLAKGFLERVLSFRDVAVLPCFVDQEVFFPRQKRMQIAYVPRKLPREAGLINAIFTLKYPHLRSVPWQAIENQPESKMADILGRSTILLSLSYVESFGLIPLEAMASGCIVAGFHGYGGLEYAKPENGFWFPPDCLEETADALAQIVTGLENGSPQLRKMLEEGAATAASYDKNRTRAALKEFYGGMI
jgi:hypothetical protein